MNVRLITPDIVANARPPSDLPLNITVYRTGRIRLSTGLCRIMQVDKGCWIVFMEVDSQLCIGRSDKPDNGFRMTSQTDIQSADLMHYLKSYLDLPLPQLNRVKRDISQDPIHVNGFNLFIIINDSK